MKDKTATTFFRDVQGHTRRSARNKTNKNTNKMKTEREESNAPNKNINMVTTRDTAVEQQRGAGTGQTTGARAV